MESNAIIAVCVGKLYVSPVKRAMAIVAERPGSIPITRPANVDRHMTRRFIGWKTVANAADIYCNAMFHLKEELR